MSTTPSIFQARVLAAVPDNQEPYGPERVMAARADWMAFWMNTSSSAVTRALVALEASGHVVRVPLPGLTVDGWRVP